jgi:hypothetical protein
MGILGDAARSVLAEARQAHVAVETKRGAHVTPQLYAVDADDIWFFSAASTLKARSLERRTRAGAVVSAGGRDLVVVGDVDKYDVADPKRLASSLGSLPDAARAVAGYAVRNAPDLAGFARDALRGRVGRRVPPRRVLFRLRPSATAVFADGVLDEREGGWPGSASTDGEALDAGAGARAVAAWLSTAGPVAAPARWDGATRTATVPAALVALAPLAGPGTSLVLDDYGGTGPSPKQGTLVKGAATLEARGGCATLRIDPDVTTTWNGVETSSTRRS